MDHLIWTISNAMDHFIWTFYIDILIWTLWEHIGTLYDMTIMGPQLTILRPQLFIWRSYMANLGT